MLGSLLDSLVSQRLPEFIQLELIVVDNDAQGSAKEVFEQYAEKASSLNFQYHIQPQKNISLTRNTAVAAAQGDYLLFIDDDEVASPDWVSHMVQAIIDYDADAAFGRVISEFSPNTPEWIRQNYLFNRPCGSTGTPTLATRTSNCIVKASLIKSIPGPFDPAYGITGGEDSHLFERLKRQFRAKYIDCYEGWVKETIPDERTRPEWLLQRARRTGNIFTRRHIELAVRQQLFVRMKFFIRGLSLLIISTLLMIAFLPSQYRRLHWRMKAEANIGRLSAVFGHTIQGY
jgi:succinoglycan biosynthesis protein ExoM